MFASNVCVKCKTEKFAQKNWNEKICAKDHKKEIQTNKKLENGSGNVAWQPNSKRLLVTAVSRNGWFYLSQSESTQPENCIYLQLTIKLSPLHEAATRYATFINRCSK